MKYNPNKSAGKGNRPISGYNLSNWYKNYDTIDWSNMSKKYPNIYKLQINIRYDNNVPYVLLSEIHSKLNKKQRDIFSKFFGARTCLLIRINGENMSGLYPWDVENVLERILMKY